MCDLALHQLFKQFSIKFSGGWLMTLAAAATVGDLKTPADADRGEKLSLLGCNPAKQ